MSKTTMCKQAEITRQWHLIDLDEKTLGRAATKMATLLIGKHKKDYTPHLDCGDYVVVINASKVKVTGGKETKKLYRHHTGYPGGFREFTYEQVKSKDPTKIIQQTVKGMLPKNKLRSQRLKRLKVFSDNNHPYTNQLEK